MSTAHEQSTGSEARDREGSTGGEARDRARQAYSAPRVTRYGALVDHVHGAGTRVWESGFPRNYQCLCS